MLLLNQDVIVQNKHLINVNYAEEYTTPASQYYLFPTLLNVLIKQQLLTRNLSSQEVCKS